MSALPMDMMRAAARDRRRTAPARAEGLERNRESGQGLLLLLVILTILLTVIGVSFIARMNLRQRLVGDRYRAMAARYMAEAGVEKAIWYLEGRAPDGSEDASWRPREYREHLQASGINSWFTVQVGDLSDGLVSIVSWGEAGGSRQGVRVTARLSPRALDHALFSAGPVAIEGGQAKVVLTGPAGETCLPRVLVGANAEIWFRTRRSSLELGPSCAGRADALQLGLANLNRLTVGDLHQPIADLDRLRSFGVNVVNADAVALRRIEREAIPSLDEHGLRRLAIQNMANEALNQVAGRAAGSLHLAQKRDSLYTAGEFAQLLQYLRGRDIPLVGPIFAGGPVILPAGGRVIVTQGFLATDGGLTIQPGASLMIRHQPGSRLLPGLITLTRETYAPIVVGEGASVTVDGAIVAEGVIDVRQGSNVEVSGAVVAAEAEYGLRLDNATLMVRYDPAVRGTVGVLAGKGRKRVVPVAWQELR